MDILGYLLLRSLLISMDFASTRSPRVGIGLRLISILMYSSVMCILGHQIHVQHGLEVSWFLKGEFSHSELRGETTFLIRTLPWRVEIL